jgi:hypothetical protein
MECSNKEITSEDIKAGELLVEIEESAISR